MYNQRGLLAEAFVTLRAGIGPFPSVTALVGHQILAAAEGFLTHGAGEGFLSSVGSLVGHQ